MKEKIAAFIDQLILYDYLLFGAAVFLVILLLLLSILLRKKPFPAILLILTAFTVMVLAPTLGYSQMHAMIFKNSTSVNSVKALKFTQALIIYGDLTNESNHDFSQCALTAGVYKIADNVLLDTLYPLNPFKKETILIKDVPIGQTVAFKIIVEPFTYQRDYNVSIGAKCR